jgi:hypothetical protein
MAESEFIRRQIIEKLRERGVLVEEILTHKDGNTGGSRTSEPAFGALPLHRRTPRAYGGAAVSNAGEPQ